MKRKNKGKVENKQYKKLIKSLGKNPKYLREYQKNKTLKQKEIYFNSLFEVNNVNLELAFFEIILDLSNEYFKIKKYEEIINTVLKLKNKRSDYFLSNKESYYIFLIGASIYLENDKQIEKYFLEASHLMKENLEEFYNLSSFLNNMGKYDISYKILLGELENITKGEDKDLINSFMHDMGLIKYFLELEGKNPDKIANRKIGIQNAYLEDIKELFNISKSSHEWSINDFIVKDKILDSNVDKLKIDFINYYNKKGLNYFIVYSLFNIAMNFFYFLNDDDPFSNKSDYLFAFKKEEFTGYAYYVTDNISISIEESILFVYGFLLLFDYLKKLGLNIYKNIEKEKQEAIKFLKKTYNKDLWLYTKIIESIENILKDET